MSLSVWLTGVFWPRQQPRTGCPGIRWSHGPWRCLRKGWMRHAVPRSSGHGGAGSQHPTSSRPQRSFPSELILGLGGGTGWCLPRRRVRSGHDSSQGSHVIPGARPWETPASPAALPAASTARRARRTAAAAARAPAAVGGSLGGASRFPPLPLASISAVRRRLSVAASSLGSPERGRSRHRLPRRKVSCGLRGWEGEGRGLAPSFSVLPFPPARCFPCPGGRRWERGWGRARPPVLRVLGRAGAALPGASFLRHPGCKWPITGMAVCLSVCVCLCVLGFRQESRLCGAGARCPQVRRGVMVVAAVQAS